MCGIAGWAVREARGLAREHAEAMGAALLHRGPDDAGIYLDADHGLALAHRRLSIVDLSARGRQPMVDPSSGNVLAFNGEIYNHGVLRERLAGLGHEFRSRCDTEVLLAALSHWGIDALDQLQGMYAFAYWQRERATLHLARDPMGIKPLYYWPDPSRGGLVFASELKALVGLPGFRACVDREALQQFLEFGYTFDEHRTIFEDVRKLPPGHRLEVRAGRVGTCIRHFSPDLDTAALGARAALEDELHATLRQVVHEHLAADVPVALLLSGGLDSSLLAALAVRETELHTFSFGFADSGVDERPEARRVAEHLGTQHEEFLIAPGDLMSGLEDSVAQFDDLFADWGLVSTRMVYQRCRERGAKVVIVGEGADELFAGYHGRFAPGLAAARPAALDWRLFKLYRRYAARRYGRLFPRFRARMREHLRASGGDLFAAIRLFESRDQLPNSHVMKVDKASMAVSVEARVPFLDARIARLAYRVPGELLVDRTGTKLLLRGMARRHRLLPDDVIERGKFGAGIANSWIESSTPFRDYAACVVLGDEGWVDALGLRRAMTAYFGGERQGYPFPHAISIFSHLAWRLVLLNLWSRRFGLSPAHG